MKHRVSQSGFSLIEALIASSIIVVGLLAVLTLINSSLHLAEFARDELVAANLAQEGVEIVHAVRDENWINKRPFDSGLADGQYLVNYSETQILPYQDTPLRFDDTSGFFQYQSGASTPFKRIITITKVSSIELRVTSQVTWQAHGIPLSVNAEDHLFDWLPQK